MANSIFNFFTENTKMDLNIRISQVVFKDSCKCVVKKYFYCSYLPFKIAMYDREIICVYSFREKLRIKKISE